MKRDNREHDCLRGCEVITNSETSEKTFKYNRQCCKLSVFDWLDGLEQSEYNDFYEVRFKNTRKSIFKSEPEASYKIGDIVVVEAQTGHDVGIVSLSGCALATQIKRNESSTRPLEYKRIYRIARGADIEKWQNAIAREHKTMIRSRQMAASLQLNMKIGDVEFQGDGSKAIFYYIADERVDFRQLIKDFAEEFRVRIEMKQIGARQEAGLIGGLGVCGQALCCSRYMNNFHSITTQAARSQDLSLNPQKLTGQCGKLKCCINYEASVYIDAQSKMPFVKEPLQLEDGEAHLMKTDILRGIMWFSYDPNSMANMVQLSSKNVREIISINRRGGKAKSLFDEKQNKSLEFMSATGEESISRFDNDLKRKKGSSGRKNRDDNRRGDRDRRREPRDNREGDDSREPREPREHREPREPRGQRDQRGSRDQREPMDREHRGNREPRKPRESSERRDQKDQRGQREPKEPRGVRESKEPRGPKEQRDQRAPRESKEHREPREPKGQREERGTK